MSVYKESWEYRRARMQVGRGKAETLIQIDLQLAGLERNLTTNRGFTFTKHETRHIAKRHVLGTNVDGLYMNYNVIYFLDGPHHSKGKQPRKDEAIDRVLRHRGFTVLRFPYVPPISKKRRIEIVSRISEVLLKNGYPKDRIIKQIKEALKSG